MLKILSLFSGYGGCEFALKKIGIEHECIGYSDIDPYANQCFKQNHKGKELGDVNKIIPEELEDFDLLTGGFPCVSFSIAGKREGFENERTGNLFFEIIRIAKVKKSKYMLLENVKGILSHDEGRTHKRVLTELKKIGYGVAWKCLNSKEHGIPQNRERVWYVCKLGGWEFMEFMFPEKEKLKIFIKDILEENVDKKYFLSKKAIRRLTERNNDCTKGISGSLTANMFKQNWNTPIIADFRFDVGLRIRKDNCSPCLAASNGEGISSSILVHSLFPRSGNPTQGGTGPLSKDDGTSYCLDTGNCQAIEIPAIDKDSRWRRLTPTECFRLMGFLDDNINLDGLSDTRCYKLAGNGWDINVASKILYNMFKNTEFMK